MMIWVNIRITDDSWRPYQLKLCVLSICTCLHIRSSDFIFSHNCKIQHHWEGFCRWGRDGNTYLCKEKKMISDIFMKRTRHTWIMVLCVKPVVVRCLRWIREWILCEILTRMIKRVFSFVYSLRWGADRDVLFGRSVLCCHEGDHMCLIFHGATMLCVRLWSVLKAWPWW